VCPLARYELHFFSNYAENRAWFHRNLRSGWFLIRIFKWKWRLCEYARWINPCVYHVTSVGIITLDIIIFTVGKIACYIGRARESRLNCTTHFGRGIARGMKYRHIYTRAYTSRSAPPRPRWWQGCGVGTLRRWSPHVLFRQIIRLVGYHANAVYRYDQPGIGYTDTPVSAFVRTFI